MGEVRPNEFEADIADLDGLTGQIILDRAFNRNGVINEIADRIDRPMHIESQHEALTMPNLAHLYLEVSDKDTPVSRIIHQNNREMLVAKVADEYGLETTPNQDELRKQQLICILIALETGEVPDHAVDLPVQDSAETAQKKLSGGAD